MPSIHAFVTGRVQGVFYRQSTQEKAKELGLTGWVKNCHDGRVELLASGDEMPLKELQEWLWQGPPLASVTAVEIKAVADPELKKFEAE